MESRKWKVEKRKWKNESGKFKVESEKLLLTIRLLIWTVDHGYMDYGQFPTDNSPPTSTI
jgi:hypothetical protein